MERDYLMPAVERAAAAHELPLALVCAMVEQESGWNPYAIRSESESGFARRYGAEYTRIVKASASKRDDWWLRFEDLFYASYGLMQAMYPCVIEMLPELGARLAFPTELCDPTLGLAAGCGIFKKKLFQARGEVERALLFYNGGGNAHYAKEVLQRKAKYEQAGKPVPQNGAPR